MGKATVRNTFCEALDNLVEQVKEDRSILAAILCGSLSHDTVWEKSDIDLVFVTIDDKKVESGELALYADGVNVHAFLMPRAEFRKTVEGAVRNSFMHSLLAKGRLLYTHDETIADLCARLQEIGERDTQVQLLARRRTRSPPIYKAHKWLVTRGDLDYTRALDSLRRDAAGADRGDRPAAARRPRGDPAGDEAEPGVLQDGLHRPAQREEDAEERAGGAGRDRRLPRRSGQRRCSRPVIDHLREVGEARSCTEIESHFERNFECRRRDHGVRVPGRPGAHRQGLDAGAAHQEEQHRGAGAGIRFTSRASLG